MNDKRIINDFECNQQTTVNGEAKMKDISKRIEIKPIFAWVLAAMGIASQAAQAELVCPIYQITRTVNVGLGISNTDASVNSAGTRIAFVSAADFTGGNPGLFRQVFLYDTTNNKFTQITNVTADNCACANSGPGEPSISANGTRIAFSSPDDLTGRNPEFNEEIFLFDTTNGQLTQVTDSTTGISSAPVVSPDGTSIAFHSNSDLLTANGVRNTDGNNEVFVFYDTNSGIANGIFPVTDTTAGPPPFFLPWSFNPSLSSDGRLIAFDSTANLTGGNSDGNFELYTLDAVAGTYAQITTTVTRANGGSSMNPAGTRIAFMSSNNLTGGNADLNTEIFAFDSGTSTFTQVTNTTGGDSGAHTKANASPSVTANGTRIAFLSNRNLTGQNADGNFEIFRFDANTGTLVQVTNTTGGDNNVALIKANDSPSVTADGTHIAFDSNRDLMGQNADGNRELFLATCLVPPPCDGQSPTKVGTPFNDVINGTAGVDVIVGLSGNDTISGLAGNDRICGGTGNDLIKGGGGNDRLFGQEGNDTLNGEAGTDRCDAGSGSDSSKKCETKISIP